MKMSIRTGVAGAGMAALMLVGTSAAFATHTSVSVNGSRAVGDVPYTATKDTAAVSFITNYGVEMRCSTASITGAGSVIKRGQPVGVGNTLATIGNLSFGGCMMGAFPVTVSMTGGNINVRNHPTNANDPVDVTITGISADITSTSSSLPCDFDAAGTLKAVIKPGTVGGKDATIELVPADFAGSGSNFDLNVSNVTGCAAEVQNGDKAGSFYYDESLLVRSAFVVDTTGVVTHN